MNEIKVNYRAFAKVAFRRILSTRFDPIENSVFLILKKTCRYICVARSTGLHLTSALNENDS